MNQEDCKVAFENKRLKINDGRGITKRQVVSIHKSRICRKPSALFPAVKSCFKVDYDKDFKITYRTYDDNFSTTQTRTAMVTFRDESTSIRFQSDLETWFGDQLRKVGSP